MTLNQEAKKILLRKIPHGLFICGVRDEEKDEVNQLSMKINSL